MKQRILVLFMAPFFLLAADKKKTEVKQPQAAKPLTLPADAKQVESNAWRYTDSQGRNWTYRKTPFGLVRYEEKTDAKAAEEIPTGMAAVEQGDSIQFERPAPFGKYRWTRKKSELTEMEQKVWERERAKNASAVRTQE